MNTRSILIESYSNYTEYDCIIKMIDQMDNFSRIILIVYRTKETFIPVYVSCQNQNVCIGGVSVCLLAIQEEERGKKIEQVLIRILDIINQTINRSRDFIVSIIIFNEIFDITVYNV